MSTEVNESMRIVAKHGDGRHTAKVYKDSDWGEYRVKFYTDNKHVGEDADYHTDDMEDANDTAKSALNKMYSNESKNEPRNESVESLVSAIFDQDENAASSAFNAVISNKILDRFSEMKIEIAQSLGTK